MAKQYVVTETEFEALLAILKLERFTCPTYLHGQFEKAVTSRYPTIDASNTAAIAKELADAVHRTFHYHVVSWIQEMKK